MPGIEWIKEYSVNIKVLDEQHHQIIGVCNLLNEIILAEQSQQRMNEVFNHLMRYVTVHFSTEEKLMAEHGFPGYEEHCAEHAQCREAILKYKGRFEQGEKNLPVALVVFLSEWLHHHLLEVDKKYTSFLNERGVF